jgi:hypothetical protein
MQDGEFQDGQITYAIGRAIFVFAGGTAHSREQFKSKVEVEENRPLKGTDFLSRIKGFIDVLGPNPNRDDAVADPYYVIRRAVLLRSILERQYPDLFEASGRGKLNIDDGLVSAFLQVPRFEHGARSMESIVAMSRLRGKRVFARSSLPSEEQLFLHVNGQAFMSLVQMLGLNDPEVVERVAEELHEFYRRKDPNKVPYADLSPVKKEQNRENVRDIPKKLAMIQCAMMPMRRGQASVELSRDEIEKLAEIEHDRWMRTYLVRDWRWARRTDPDNRRHKDLVPWREMSADERERRYSKAGAAALGPGILQKAEKEKDRDVMRATFRILARHGYAVVRVPSDRG